MIRINETLKSIERQMHFECSASHFAKAPLTSLVLSPPFSRISDLQALSKRKLTKVSKVIFVLAMESVKRIKRKEDWVDDVSKRH